VRFHHIQQIDNSRSLFEIDNFVFFPRHDLRLDVKVPDHVTQLLGLFQRGAYKLQMVGFAGIADGTDA
jgi:hypothetical protein